MRIFIFNYFRRRVQPKLCNEERESFLSTVLDKTIGASSEVAKLQ
jgi:hypothetical protein